MSWSKSQIPMGLTVTARFVLKTDAILNTGNTTVFLRQARYNLTVVMDAIIYMTSSTAVLMF